MARLLFLILIIIALAIAIILAADDRPSHVSDFPVWSALT